MPNSLNLGFSYGGNVVRICPVCILCPCCLLVEILENLHQGLKAAYMQTKYT